MAKKIFNGLITVFLVVLIVLVALMFLARASGNSFSIFGVHLYRVTSSSMEPALKKEDIIVVTKTDPESIKIDDIVTYRANRGEMAGQPITHRVVTEPVNVNGTWVFQTKGDADGAELDRKITSEQLIGKYVFTIPLLGKLYSFFLTPAGLITMIVVIVVLFGYEMISLIISYRAIDNIGRDLNERVNKKSKNSDKNDFSDESESVDVTDSTEESDGNEEES